MTRFRFALLAAFCFGTQLPTVTARADTIPNPALLPDGDGGAGDQFGTALALHGDTLVVGVPRDNPTGNNSGSVYVFRRTAGVWTHDQRLVPADSSVGESFGFSVAVHGDTLIVGTPNAGSSDEGAAYLYARSGSGPFAPQQKLTVTPMTPPRNFGWSVAAGPDVVWVGSPSHRVVGNFQGSATQYKRAGGTWQEGPTFGPFNGTGGETFGLAMSYADGHLIVTERGEDVGAQNFAGAAIAYRYDGTLTQLNVISAPGVQSFDQFGASVAVDGIRAVVGATPISRPGYAQPFRFDGTQWLADGGPLSLGASRFGAAVAIDGERIAVAAPGSAGAVQLYERIGGQWMPGELLSPPDLGAEDGFGTAVQFDGNDVIAGLPGRDVAGGAEDVGEVRTLPAPPDAVYRDGFE